MEKLPETAGPLTWAETYVRRGWPIIPLNMRRWSGLRIVLSRSSKVKFGSSSAMIKP